MVYFERGSFSDLEDLEWSCDLWLSRWSRLRMCPGDLVLDRGRSQERLLPGVCGLLDLLRSRLWVLW